MKNVTKTFHFLQLDFNFVSGQLTPNISFSLLSRIISQQLVQLFTSYEASSSLLNQLLFLLAETDVTDDRYETSTKCVGITTDFISMPHSFNDVANADLIFTREI